MADIDERILRAAKTPTVAPLPWTGKEEEYPIADSGDADIPFVIRDATGKVVIELFERYGNRMELEHIVIGQRILAAINGWAP